MLSLLSFAHLESCELVQVHGDPVSHAVRSPHLETERESKSPGIKTKANVILADHDTDACEVADMMKDDLALLLPSSLWNRRCL